MAQHGQCHCGAIRYAIDEDAVPKYSGLCHCRDCQLASGAPVVSWAMFPVDAVTITGTPNTYASSEHGRRQFCGTCGTSLFYTNSAYFPGVIDVITATLDNPDAFPATAHIQIADRISWMATAHTLPMYERFPEE